MKICPYCKGTGKTIIYFGIQDFEYFVQNCPVCGGKKLTNIDIKSLSILVKNTKNIAKNYGWEVPYSK